MIKKFLTYFLNHNINLAFALSWSVSCHHVVEPMKTPLADIKSAPFHI